MSKRKFMNSRSRMRRKIVIGCSSAAIITLCGVVGFNYILSDNSAIKNVLFGGQGINSYSDQSPTFELNEYTLKQIESNLSTLGFGYDKKNVNNYWLKDYEEELGRIDPTGSISLPERFYIWNKDLKMKDRPKYVAEAPNLLEYMEEPLVTKETIKLYYNIWLAVGMPNDIFDITNIRNQNGELIADVIFPDETKATVKAVWNTEEGLYQTATEGTISEQQIERFKLLKIGYDNWTQQNTEHKLKEPKLADKQGEEYKYIDFTVVTEINEFNVETCYNEWVEAGRPSEAFSVSICVISKPQIEKFKQFDSDVAAWKSEGEEIVMPDILDHVAPSDIDEKNIQAAYDAWVSKGAKTESMIITTSKWYGTISYTQAEEFAKYKTKKEEYDKWIKWRNDRNNWLRNQRNQGFFTEQPADGTEGTQEDRYRNYWAKIARKALGLDEVDVMDEEAYKELYAWLTAQIFDKDGNIREDISDILQKAINEEDYTIYDKDDTAAPDKPGEGGDTGGEGGDNPGGGDDGDKPGGGDDGDKPGGGDNPGSEEPEEPEEPEDTVPAKMQGITVTSPATGIYGEGQKVQIKVSFDKDIYGTDKKGKIDGNTAPKLIIRFGNGGTDRTMDFESVSGSSIMYSYIVKKDDNGSLQLAEGDNFVGKIYNRSGYETELTKIQTPLIGNDIQIDNEAPVVRSIECISPKGTYGASEGQQKEVKIKVTFNEAVYTARNEVPIIADTAPVFMASFGAGEPVKFVFDLYSEQEKSITYKYTITEKDKGKLRVDDVNTFDGTREVFDAQGNSVKLKKGVKLQGTEIIANETLARLELDKYQIELDLKNKPSGAELTDKLTATLVGFEEGTTVIWSSDNESVVTVDINGVITAKKIGQVIISAKIQENDNVIAEAKCKVTVKNTTQGETQIEIENKDVTLDLNGKNEADILANVVLVDKDGNVIPSDQKITFISKDENIAKVEDGKIIAVNPGETTIIARTEDGTEVEINVTIKDSASTKKEPTAINVETATITVDLSKTKEINLIYTIEPSDTNTKNKVTFTSSNEKVATVDENGKVTILGKGTVVIMLATENGKKAYTTIRVIDVSEEEDLKDIDDGDYNKDDNIDTVDLLTLLRHIAASKSTDIAKKHQDWIILDKNYYLLDVNKDGVVDTADVLLLQRHMAATASESIANKHPDWKLNK